MRLPIALALGWPDRVPDAAAGLRLDRRAQLGVLPAGRRGVPRGRAGRGGRRGRWLPPAVYNAANEECVAAFLAGRLPFLAIVDTVAAVLGEHDQWAGNRYRR